MDRNPHHSALAAAALGLLVPLLACGASPPVPRWTPAGSSHVGRLFSNAVFLPSGKVLVLGGLSSCLQSGCYGTLEQSDTALADLYDPETGTWAATGSLLQARQARAQAVLVPTSAAACAACGKVLVAGGFPGVSGLLDSAELYDPATGRWTPTGSLQQRRFNGAAAVLASGKVLLAGGVGGEVVPNWREATDTAELFDPVTGTWTPAGTLHEARYGYAAVALPSGKVLVAGGINGSGTLSSAEVYDPADGSWTKTGSLSSPRAYGQAVRLGSGRVLVVCGSGSGAAAEVYDSEAGAWAPTKPMANARSTCSATLLSSGMVLVAGGTDLAVSEELYDPATDTWQAAGQMAARRFWPLAAPLPSGRALVVGGVPVSQGTFPLASAELFGFE